MRCPRFHSWDVPSVIDPDDAENRRVGMTRSQVQLDGIAMPRKLMLFGAVILLFAILPASVLAKPTNNTGAFTDPTLHFSVTWDPEEFALATVATGGILLSRDAMVLMIGPDTNPSAEDCVANRVQIDMIDAPLLFAIQGQLDPKPAPSGVTDDYAAIYAWPDGIRHYAWIGCIPLESGGNIVLRLLARTEDWETAVTTFEPVLETITLPENTATPGASPATM